MKEPFASKANMGIPEEDHTPDSPATTQAGHSPIMEKEFDSGKPVGMGVLDTNANGTESGSREQDDTGSDSPATPKTEEDDSATAATDNLPPQSEKMTKKQIIVVMFALCVSRFQQTPPPAQATFPLAFHGSGERRMRDFCKLTHVWIYNRSPYFSRLLTW